MVDIEDNEDYSKSGTAYSVAWSWNRSGAHEIQDQYDSLTGE